MIKLCLIEPSSRTAQNLNLCFKMIFQSCWAPFRRVNRITFLETNQTLHRGDAEQGTLRTRKARPPKARSAWLPSSPVPAHPHRPASTMSIKNLPQSSYTTIFSLYAKLSLQHGGLVKSCSIQWQLNLLRSRPGQRRLFRHVQPQRPTPNPTEKQPPTPWEKA